MALEFLKIHSQTMAKEIVTQQNLFHMVEKRQWSSVMKLIQSNIGELRPPDHNDSLLHQACRHQPPVEFIKVIVNADPDLATLVNFDGHSPLHIAAQHGASPEVIRFLCSSYPDTSEFQDVSGRTPLHLACESYSKRYLTNYKNTPSRTAQEALLLTVMILVRTSPTTVNLEDVHGMSATEYVLDGDGDIDMKVLRVIQRASVREWERRRVLGENIAKDLAQKQYPEEGLRLQQEFRKQRDYSIQHNKSYMARSA